MASYNDHGLTIDALDIGVSEAGTEQYLEELKASYLLAVKDKIETVSAIDAALDRTWQGQSRDAFDNRFKKMREEIIADLEAEYNDLRVRIEELANNYIQQDINMIRDGE